MNLYSELRKEMRLLEKMAEERLAKQLPLTDPEILKQSAIVNRLAIQFRKETGEPETPSSQPPLR